MVATEVILDTNVFVAAGFNQRSASALILKRVRSGQLLLIWNESTRAETRCILNRIPPLSWDSVADLFRDEGFHQGTLSADEFAYVPDPDDRKFAALTAATGAALLTNDTDLLSNRDRANLDIQTPSEFCRKFSG